MDSVTVGTNVSTRSSEGPAPSSPLSSKTLTPSSTSSSVPWKKSEACTGRVRIHCISSRMHMP